MLGVAFCARCGGRMTRSPSRHPGRVYLRCPTHANSRAFRRLGYRRCHPNHIYEYKVWSALNDFLLSVVTVEDLNELLVQESTPDRAERRLEEIKALLAEYETQRRRLADALAVGHMQSDMYAEKDNDLLERIGKLHAERAQLARRKVRAVPVARRFASMEEVEVLLRQGMANAAPHEINVLLLEAGIRIEVEGGEVQSIGVYA